MELITKNINALIPIVIGILLIIFPEKFNKKVDLSKKFGIILIVIGIIYLVVS